PGVGIQKARLLPYGPYDLGMAVTHQRDVVIGIEIRPAGFVIEVLTPPTYDFQGILVGKAKVGSEERAPQGERFRKWYLLGEELGRNSQQQVGIGTEGLPDLPLRGSSHTRKILVLFQQIGDDLEMQMWRPSAILVRSADPGEKLALCDALAYSNV